MFPLQNYEHILVKGVTCLNIHIPGMHKSEEAVPIVYIDPQQGPQ